MEKIDINEIKRLDNINEYYEKLEEKKLKEILNENNQNNQNNQNSQNLTIDNNLIKNSELIDLESIQKIEKVENFQNEIAENINKEITEKENDSKKIKTKKKLRINLYRQRGDCKLIRHIINKNKWIEVHDLKSADMLWAGRPIMEEDFNMAYDCKISRIPGMMDLCHKKETGYILNKFLEFFPDNFSFVPRTFLIPEESRKFQDFCKEKTKEKKRQLYIAKPSNTCQGEGIILIKEPKEIPEHHKGLVVQEYISRPLLIDKKKFDLRLYILIASIDPFVCFLNEEGLARFATENYENPTMKNIKNNFMHLTNYSLNKQNTENYIYTEETQLINQGTKRTLSSFWKSIESEGHSKTAIINSIEELLTNLLCSIYPFVRYNVNMCYGTKKVRPYQILGIDVMLDKDLKPWLMELNSNPSFNINHDSESNIINDQPGSPRNKRKEKENNYAEYTSPVDLWVKERVLEDALIIMKKSVNKAISIGRGEMFNSYKLLIDGKIPEMEEMDLFTILLEVYGALSGNKFRGNIGNTKFNKIINYSSILKEGMSLVESDMIFQKAAGKFMDFYSFINAIELMAKKYVGYKDENEKIYAVMKLVKSFKIK